MSLFNSSSADPMLLMEFLPAYIRQQLPILLRMRVKKNALEDDGGIE